MNIGIDIDDTISNSFESVFASSQKFDIEQVGGNGNVKQYGRIASHKYIETMYPNWTEEQINLFWKKYFIDMLTKATPKTYAPEIIKKIREENNKIILITSRHEEIAEKNLIEEYTKKWLDENKILYDKLIMNAQDKLIAAKKENIDLFIDDSTEHCRKVKEGNIKTLLYNTICNQSLDVSDLERVYSWEQIYLKYSELKNN